jgi:hypothetical protein
MSEARQPPPHQAGTVLRRIVRDRRLTPEEAAEYKKLREQIQADLPDLIARHHATANCTAEHREQPSLPAAASTQVATPIPGRLQCTVETDKEDRCLRFIVRDVNGVDWRSSRPHSGAPQLFGSTGEPLDYLEAKAGKAGFVHLCQVAAELITATPYLAMVRIHGASVRGGPIYVVVPLTAFTPTLSASIESTAGAVTP